MNFVAVFMSVFSVIGGIDLIFGNRLGLGKQFEKGFMLFGNIALSMIGMIVLAPLIGELIQPVSDFIYNYFGIDPSILPSMLFANDMGGASLADSMAIDKSLAHYNGLVISSMMGCTISFTIPIALSIVKLQQHKYVLSGFLCGIITIPVGCFVAGLLLKIKLNALIVDLLPMVAFSILIAFGLIYFPKMCVKIFSGLGVALKTLITIGLILGIIRFLTGVEVIKGLETLEEGGKICINASVVMSGAFPFLHIISKLISKPLRYIGKKLNINEQAVFGFFSTLATSVTTFNEMKNMDKKGVYLNSAFAISGAFIFAGHLAFTMSFNSDYVAYVIIGKLISGILAVALANAVYKRTEV